MKKEGKMNDINNNVNFTARMDVKQVLDTQRWKNISKIFRQTTKEYPHDTFRLTEYIDRIEANGINSKTGNEIEVQFNFENIAKLMEMSDEKIAEKFKKMLDISAHKQRIYDATKAYTERLSQLTEKDFSEDMDILDKATKIANKETKSMQNKDSFLKDIDILF